MRQSHCRLARWLPKAEWPVLIRCSDLKACKPGPDPLREIRGIARLLSAFIDQRLSPELLKWQIPGQHTSLAIRFN